MDHLVIINPTRNVGYRDHWFSTRKYHKLIKNIESEIHRFDRVWITHDVRDSNDPEFNYLPERCVGNLFYGYDIDGLHLKNKKFLSLFREQPPNFIVSKDELIVLAGFSLSLDIIPTTLDLIQGGYNVKVSESMTEDLSDEYKELSLNYLRIFGVVVP